MHFVYLASMVGAIIGPMIKKALRFLGVGVVTYMGFNLVIDEAKDALLAKFGTLDSPVQQLLGLAQIDVAINIVFAAIAARALMAGFGATDRKGRYKFLTGDAEG
jgi:disulfide bond formation protein DsbB